MRNHLLVRLRQIVPELLTFPIKPGTIKPGTIVIFLPFCTMGSRDDLVAKRIIAPLRRQRRGQSFLMYSW
jgi:hypothetical protein